MEKYQEKADDLENKVVQLESEVRKQELNAERA